MYIIHVHCLKVNNQQLIHIINPVIPPVIRISFLLHYVRYLKFSTHRRAFGFTACMYARHTLPSSYNITSPQGPRIHLPVTYFLFYDITFHLMLALSASLRPKYGTPYLFTSANLKLTLPSDVIFQPILPPSGPCNAP